jgi:hypothetical protein
MGHTAYTLKHIEKAACTMVLPKGVLDRIRLISKRTGVPSNTIAALALDEYLTRRYPVAEAGVQQGGEEEPPNTN